MTDDLNARCRDVLEQTCRRQRGSLVWVHVDDAAAVMARFGEAAALAWAQHFAPCELGPTPPRYAIRAGLAAARGGKQP